ncbi:MAG TPA: dTDP-4-dehydrorhamnose 3,5-epimerase [Anaerolineales bacterium]
MIHFTRTEIPDLILVQPDRFEDPRGYFLEAYRKDLFAAAGISATFVQDNQSGSAQGVLRGLHYQIEHAQGKLVRVISGEIYDVAVDIRRSAPTFGHWIGLRLSARDRNELWIPEGFAHGFYVLSETAEIHYKATDYYAPECERTVLWNDPSLGIRWPLHDGRLPIVSAKDAAGKLLREAETYA